MKSEGSQKKTDESRSDKPMTVRTETSYKAYLVG